MRVLGFDTSNYTTSVAQFDGQTGLNCSRLLDVKPGQLGLRQSDALFAHVQRLPALFARLMAETPEHTFAAVGVSTRPREVAGSYMPCFLAGKSMAETLSSALDVPVHFFSHQQGHIAAALWSAGRMDLLERPHLAWHLSGGTTELLLVRPSDGCVAATRIGGTTDIAAGQLIDRMGKLLGLGFPAGRELDALSRRAQHTDGFRVKVHGTEFSLSGVENQVQACRNAGFDDAETAAYALHSLIGAILTATAHAAADYPGLPVVFSGGVASNTLLRDRATGFEAVFAEPAYSTDNAMGIAVLTWLRERA